MEELIRRGCTVVTLLRTIREDRKGRIILTGGFLAVKGRSCV
jgi:hypothetical protein